MRRPGTGDLKIMPEYECYSFWVEKAGFRDNVDPASLGVPKELAAEIDAWERVYEATYVPDDPASSGFADEAAEAAFNGYGLRLAARTADALGPGWTVTYYDTLAKELVAVSKPPYSSASRSKNTTSAAR